MGQINSFIDRYLEGAWTKIQCVHHLLGIPQSEFRLRKLKNLLRVLRAESQRVTSINHSFSKTECKIHYTILRLLISDRIEVHGTSHTGQHRVVKSIML